MALTSGRRSGRAPWLEISVTRDGAMTTLVVRGELDLVTSPRVAVTACDELRRGARRLLLDVSDVTFADSSALAMLVNVVGSVARREGELAVKVGDGAVAPLVRRSKLDHVLPITESPTNRPRGA